MFVARRFPQPRMWHQVTWHREPNKGKKPSEFTRALGWKQAAKNCTRIEGHYSVETEISSDIPLENRRSGSSKRETALLLLERGRERAAKGLGRPARLNKTHFAGCCWNLPLLVKPWLWHELQAEEIDVGQERWRGKRARREIAGERGCSVPKLLPAPSLVKRPLQPDLSVSLWPAFQHHDALWFYSFLLEVLLKYKQQSISAGIKKIQIKEMRNSPSLQAHFKTH